jgi:hypothetical protein
MTPTFYIAHATPGRTRIRWAGDSAEKNIVSALATDIANINGVDKAEPRIVTGSIIIQHEGQIWPALESQLTDQIPLEFTTVPPAFAHNGAQTPNDSIANVDGALKHVNMDVYSIAILMLCAFAIVQALRGQFMSSSSSFLWYAFNLAVMARNKVDKIRDDTPDLIE